MTALIHTLFPPEPAPAKIKGEVRFVSAGDRSPSHGSLGLLLTVCIPPLARVDAVRGGPVRGRLREAIEAAIESALELNDAPPAGVADLADLDQSLSDQLYRARSVGAGGLVLYIPDLTSVGSLAGALDAEDSAVLRWWIAATSERPVMLLLDEANRHLGAYGPPTKLEYLVEWRDSDGLVREKKASTARDNSARDNSARDAETSTGSSAAQRRLATAADSEATKTVTEHIAKCSPVVGSTSTAVRRASSVATEPTAGSTTTAFSRRASTTAIEPPIERRDEATDRDEAAEATAVHRGERQRNDQRANDDHAHRETAQRPTTERHAHERAPAASHVELSGLGPEGSVERGLTSIDAEDALSRTAHDPRANVAQLSPDAGQPVADRVVPLFPRRESPFRKPSPSANGFAVGGGPIDWRGFANDLALARGPKPLTFVERLFMTRYVPLLEAIARGEADESAQRITDQWSDDFARSYTEGFSALRVTGKRPRMVLDAPQLASQVARLHGAKSTHLVLIDAMRFDLGMRVHDRMCDALTAQATCTERLLLWSALPTTTPVQLDLIAHGPEGLASRPPLSEQEEPGMRGRASPVLRRIKLGGRDVLKLDVVQARLHEAGPPQTERFDAMADEVANILAAHARSLPPRSLMLVFGDHGFRMESTEHGTSAGISGGASPEEVLVPGFAWLVGDVH